MLPFVSFGWLVAVSVFFAARAESPRSASQMSLLVMLALVGNALYFEVFLLSNGHYVLPLAMGFLLLSFLFLERGIEKKSF